MNNHKKRTGLLVTISVASIALGYAYFIFLPGQQKIHQSESDLNEQQRFIVESTRLTSAIRVTEMSLSRAKARVAKWTEQAPASSELAAVYATISGNAQKANATIASFDPQKTVEMKSLAMVPVQISCRANIHQLFDFLTRLESMQTTLWVDGLTITPADPRGKSLTCEFTLTIFMRSSDFSG